MLKNKNIFKIFAVFLLTIISLGNNANAAFADIDVTHPFFHAITNLQDIGVVEGYPEANGQRSFRSLQAVLRAEAVKILVLASGRDVPESREIIFDDVSKSDWFYNYVNKAAEDKIVKGFADGLFHPSSQVTRAEMLKMALVSFGVSAEKFIATEDEQWFEPYFKFGSSLRIISGDDAPHESINRGEVAEIIYRTQIVAESGFEKKYTYSGSGTASYYHGSLEGNPTANGELYDPNAMTAAHRTLPFDTRLKITYGDKFIIVRVNDRGPYHEDRIIDLSEKAFSLLAPTSAGILNVDFEVYTDPTDEKPEIPDFIRENLSEEAQNPVVPQEVAAVVETLRGISDDTEKKKLDTKTQVIFPNESVAVLTKDFFKNIELRKNFPRKYLQGSVLNFSGRANELGHKKVTVFLQEISGSQKIGEQILYSGDISGMNFAFPVVLDKAGEFFIGVVLDEEKKSRTETIEVVGVDDYRMFSESKQVFLNDFDVRVLPEESTVFLDFKDIGQHDLQKIIFSQKNRKEKILYVYGGVKSLPLSYDFFAEFEEFSTLAVDLFTAESKDGTLDTQISSWKKSAFKNFQIEKAFPDTEDERLSISNFTRYYKSLDQITFNGNISDADLNLKEEVFITSPSGHVTTNQIYLNGDQFSFDLNPRDFGRYVVELLSDQGEILFNRAIYFSQKTIIPIMKEEQVNLTGETVPNVRFWVNSVRQLAGKKSLIADVTLNNFAQKYAEQMATENFISHTSPTGMDFSARIKQANLNGEFGENLSYGTTLNLALQGLKNSASHYKNMTSIRWNKVGIGISKSKDGWYVVNVFGR